MLLCNIFSFQHFVDKDYTIVKYICILLSLEYGLHHHELLMSDILFKSNNYKLFREPKAGSIYETDNASSYEEDGLNARSCFSFFLIYVCVFVCRSTLCSDNSSSKLDTLYLSLYGKYLKSGLHVCE